MTTRDRLQKTFCTFGEKNKWLADKKIDELLGLNIAAVEKRVNQLQLLDDYPGQRVYAGDISYPIIGAALKLVPHGEDICDLGSGYGRLVLYSALVRPERVFGVELVQERVSETLRLKRKLGIENLEVKQGDVLTFPIPPVRYFINMNSLMPDVLARFLTRLKKIAERRKIHLITVSTANLIMEKQDWLNEFVVGDIEEQLAPRLFISV